MKIAMMALTLLGTLAGTHAFAAGDVLVTCAGQNQSSRNYASVEWRAENLDATPKRQYLTFATGSPLLLTATTVKNETVVTIKGGLFEFDKNAARRLVVSWNEGATATAEDNSGNYETVTCYFQHE